MDWQSTTQFQQKLLCSPSSYRGFFLFAKNVFFISKIYRCLDVAASSLLVFCQIFDRHDCNFKAGLLSLNQVQVSYSRKYCKNISNEQKGCGIFNFYLYKFIITYIIIIPAPYCRFIFHLSVYIALQQ